MELKTPCFNGFPLPTMCTTQSCVSLHFDMVWMFRLTQMNLVDIIMAGQKDVISGL